MATSARAGGLAAAPRRATASALTFVDGSAAIVRGALDAGCDFFAGYPITPASAILQGMVRDLPPRGGMAIEAEDEIASIGMCIGATLAGARAMTATSGPGLSLMSESLGLAVMGEVPLMVVDVQRMGPATGGATTVGQGDVQFARWCASGGYPIVVLAPSSVAESYSLTVRAFALAERFRCPVLLLTDKELALTRTAVPLAALSGGTPPRRRVERADPVPYLYDPPDGVPPMRHYGEVAGLRFTGSTHDERAYITKDPATVGALNRHLADKIEGHRDEIELATADLEPGADTLWLSYGVTAGAMREAVAAARRAGRKVSALTVQSLWPVPETAIGRALEGIDRVVVAELNQGQYLHEVAPLAAGREVAAVQRVDGELISPRQFLESLR